MLNYEYSKRSRKLHKKNFKIKKKIELVKPYKGKIGFDFCDKDSKIYIEVKRSSKSKLYDIMFSVSTNAEYDKVK